MNCEYIMSVLYMLQFIYRWVLMATFLCLLSLCSNGFMIMSSSREEIT